MNAPVNAADRYLRAIGREEIDQLADGGHLDAVQREAALRIAGIVPDDAAWHGFLSRLFLFCGVVLLVAALGFFIAFNWTEMGRAGKFVLLESVLVLAALPALVWAGDIKGRAALLCAVLALGPLLAFLGQTYQTGADTYELFRAWALLALPWVVVANWRPVYAAWVILVNTSLQLYFGQVFRPIWWLSDESSALAAMVLTNAALLAGFEALGDRIAGRWRTLERLCAGLMLAGATGCWLVFLLDPNHRHAWQPVLAAVAFAMHLLAYRQLRRDVLALAMWCFAGIVCAVATAAKLLGELHATSAAFLIGGLLAIGLSVLAANWLRDLAREQEAS